MRAVINCFLRCFASNQDASPSTTSTARKYIKFKSKYPSSSSKLAFSSFIIIYFKNGHIRSFFDPHTGFCYQSCATFLDTSISPFSTVPKFNTEERYIPCFIANIRVGKPRNAKSITAQGRFIRRGSSAVSNHSSNSRDSLHISTVNLTSIKRSRILSRRKRSQFY